MNEIIDKRISKNKCYGELKTGEVFIFDYETYIKTDIWEDEYKDDKLAVNLTNGSEFWYMNS